jgi:CheY-like chemotaxis protein
MSHNGNGPVDAAHALNGSNSHCPATTAKLARVLVVDDSPVSRTMISAHMKDEQFEAEEAENGAIAMEKIGATRYDLILMDIQMPVMDGYQAIRAIRERERVSGLLPIPIIAFTASSYDEDIRKALESGADMHVSKPVRKEALADAIKGLIRFDATGSAHRRTESVAAAR